MGISAPLVLRTPAIIVSPALKKLESKELTTVRDVSIPKSCFKERRGGLSGAKMAVGKSSGDVFLSWIEFSYQIAAALTLFLVLFGGPMMIPSLL